MNQVQYNVWLTAAKALVTLIVLSLTGVLAVFPANMAEITANWPVFAVSVVGALWRAYQNWSGNGGPAALKTWWGGVGNG